MIRDVLSLPLPARALIACILLAGAIYTAGRLAAVQCPRCGRLIPARNVERHEAMHRQGLL